MFENTPLFFSALEGGVKLVRREEMVSKMKRIVLCGTTNAGKTTTLKKLIDILKCNGTAMPNQSSIADSNEVTDCRVVFKVESAVVGVCTAGDKYDIVKDNEQFLKENRCDVGVEALRLNDKQWSLIKSFVCLFKGEVPLFIWKFPWTENQNVGCAPGDEMAVAKQIAKIVMEVAI